jgi:hypothetical protein
MDRHARAAVRGATHKLRPFEARQDLLVKYKDGEKKVIVPPGTPIARYTPGSAADLKVGAKIFIAAAQKQPDGSLTAPNVAVGHADR